MLLKMNGSISQSLLNVANKYRNNKLPWKGQFTPQFVEVFLNDLLKINNSSPNSLVVLDPFVGSGTVLAEYSRLDISAIGCGINPAAIYLSRIYTLAALNIKKKEEMLVELTRIVNNGQNMNMLVQSLLAVPYEKVNLRLIAECFFITFRKTYTIE